MLFRFLHDASYTADFRDIWIEDEFREYHILLKPPYE